MNINKYLFVEEDEILEEGIRFFKVSNRLQKLNEKLLQRVSMLKTEHQKEILLQNAGKIERLANKFKSLEDRYSGKELTDLKKPEIKIQYNKILKDYKDMLSLMKKEEVRNVLKSINMWGMLLITIAIPMKFIAPISNIIGINLNDTSWTSLLKRSGIYLALQLPTRVLSGILGKGIDAAIDSTTDKDTIEANIQSALKDKEI